MTAHALKGDDQRMLDYGFDDYISKPISLDGLKRALHLAQLPIK